MKQQLAKVVAHTARTAPFERGRWRIGSMAYHMLGAPHEACQVATRHGFRMNLRLSEFVDRTIYCTGEWEPLETALLRQVLRPGDSFADVGANIGYFSLLAARLVGPHGRVHAVEANPATYKLLADNVALNGFGNVSLHHAAAGSEPGSARVVSREDGNSGADYVDFSAPGEVPVVRLDTLFAGQALQLIKIDVEGAEAKVLYGAEGLLRAPDAPDIVFEFTPAFMTGQGDDAAALLPFLEACGYRILEITRHGLEPLAAQAVISAQTYLYGTKLGDA